MFIYQCRSPLRSCFQNQQFPNHCRILWLCVGLTGTRPILFWATLSQPILPEISQGTKTCFSCTWEEKGAKIWVNPRTACWNILYCLAEGSHGIWVGKQVPQWRSLPREDKDEYSTESSDQALPLSRVEICLLTEFISILCLGSFPPSKDGFLSKKRWGWAWINQEIEASSLTGADFQVQAGGCCCRGGLSPQTAFFIKFH